ncbi:glycosyltransferase [Nostoc sp. C117]|uniref:glycosyltransferase n=1 Tax=Nostoc sp. C117 TaxID=3349875 RepID=UPI00370D8AC1
MQPIHILRPCRTTGMISAHVFDEIFARNLTPELQIHPVPLISWCDEILGYVSSPLTLSEAAQKFAAATAQFDFLCPSYECIALTPLFLALRNRTRSRIKLLLIAHAPGAYLLEWILLRPLLIPGDLIIAPSESAKATIEFLYPELTEFIRVIPHPMHPLAKQTGELQRIVSLGRIHPSKLIHRQIEAMEVLRRRGYRSLKLQIAGGLTDGESKDLHQYARSLVAKIHRNQLTDCVELVGLISGDRHKAEFISNASMMLNLSVTVEESFGKSIVEALGLGVPVVASRWNGFPETVGSGGELIPVCDFGPGLSVDVTAEQIADAMERLLNSPPTPEICCEQADKFNPAIVKLKYRIALEEAMNFVSLQDFPDPLADHSLKAVSIAGLLSVTAPLQLFYWHELFNFYLEECDRIRRRLAGEVVLGESSSEWLRNILFTGTRKILECFLGGLDYSAYITTPESVSYTNSGIDLISRILAGSGTKATLSSRLACLLPVTQTGQTELLQEGLNLIQQNSPDTPTIEYLKTEIERQKNNFAAAFQLCSKELDARLWGEWTAPYLRQLARICREWKKPELALPWLKQWLEQFPDSPDSGPVWLDYCINASGAGKNFLTEAEAAFAQAKNLLGDSPTLEKVAKILQEATKFYQIFV